MFCFISTSFSSPKQNISTSKIITAETCARFEFQLLGGIFWASAMVTILFAIVWFIPIKVALLCLP